MTQTALTARGWLLLLALSLIWGSSFLTTTALLDVMAPLHVVTHRVLWAALFLWIYVLARRFPLPRDPRTIAALFVMGLSNNALPFALQAFAQQTIESGLAGILNATTAVFGPLVAALFFADERLRPHKALGVGLGFLGIVMVIGVDAIRGFDPRSVAQLAMLASTLSYALSAVWARRHLSHLRPEVAATGMLTASALTLLPLGWATVGALPIALPAPSLAAIAVYSVVITALAYLLYYRLIARAGAGNTLLVTLLIVPVAVALGALVRAEALPLNAYLGFTIIALGLALVDGRLLGWPAKGRV